MSTALLGQRAGPAARTAGAPSCKCRLAGRACRTAISRECRSTCPLCRRPHQDYCRQLACRDGVRGQGGQDARQPWCRRQSQGGKHCASPSALQSPGQAGPKPERVSLGCARGQLARVLGAAALDVFTIQTAPKQVVVDALYANKGGAEEEGDAREDSAAAGSPAYETAQAPGQASALSTHRRAQPKPGLGPDRDHGGDGGVVVRLATQAGAAAGVAIGGVAAAVLVEVDGGHARALHSSRGTRAQQGGAEGMCRCGALAAAGARGRGRVRPRASARPAAHGLLPAKGGAEACSMQAHLDQRAGRVLLARQVVAAGGVGSTLAGRGRAAGRRRVGSGGSAAGQ